MSRKPDHENRTWCPQCGAVCTETISDDDWIVFHAIKEPTIGTYTEPELVKVFAERDHWQSIAQQLADALENTVDCLKHQTFVFHPNSPAIQALAVFHTAKGK